VSGAQKGIVAPRPPSAYNAALAQRSFKG